MDENNENIVVLLDEEGNKLEFLYLDSVEVDRRNYAVLLPAEDEDGGVYIFAIVEDGEGNSYFEAVEDESIIDRAFELFRENNQDEFDFED